MTDTAINNNQLFLLVSEGDEQAFRELFSLYVPRLQALIRRITKSAEVADDLVQETFLKVWIARDQLSEIRNPESWILRIGFFLAINYVKRQNHYNRILGQVGYQQAAGQSINPTEESVAYNQILKVLSEAIGRLPLKQQEAYLLSRQQGLTITQIAEKMGLALSTVKNLLVAALKQLKQALADAGHAIPFILFLIFL